MVDVSKTIGSGDWDIVERHGWLYLIRYGYRVELVLSPQNALELLRFLDAYLERRAYEWAKIDGSVEAK